MFQCWLRNYRETKYCTGEDYILIAHGKGDDPDVVLSSSNELGGIHRTAIVTLDNMVEHDPVEEHCLTIVDRRGPYLGSTRFLSKNPHFGGVLYHSAPTPAKPFGEMVHYLRSEKDMVFVPCPDPVDTLCYYLVHGELREPLPLLTLTEARRTAYETLKGGYKGTVEIRRYVPSDPSVCYHDPVTGGPFLGEPWRHGEVNTLEVLASVNNRVYTRANTTLHNRWNLLEAEVDDRGLTKGWKTL